MTDEKGGGERVELQESYVKRKSRPDTNSID